MSHLDYWAEHWFSTVDIQRMNFLDGVLRRAAVLDFYQSKMIEF